MSSINYRPIHLSPANFKAPHIPKPLAMPMAHLAQGGMVTAAPARPVQVGRKVYSQAEVKALLDKLAQLGHGKDEIIAHINPGEAKLLRSRGGSGDINPKTGLREFDDGCGGCDTGGCEAGGEGMGGEDILGEAAPADDAPAAPADDAPAAPADDAPAAPDDAPAAPDDAPAAPDDAPAAPADDAPAAPADDAPADPVADPADPAPAAAPDDAAAFAAAQQSVADLANQADPSQAAQNDASPYGDLYSSAALAASDPEAIAATAANANANVGYNSANIFIDDPDTWNLDPTMQEFDPEAAIAANAFNATPTANVGALNMSSMPADTINSQLVTTTAFTGAPPEDLVDPTANTLTIHGPGWEPGAANQTTTFLAQPDNSPPDLQILSEPASQASQTAQTTQQEQAQTAAIAQAAANAQAAAVADEQAQAQAATAAASQAQSAPASAPSSQSSSASQSQSSSAAAPASSPSSSSLSSTLADILSSFNPIGSAQAATDHQASSFTSSDPANSNPAATTSAAASQAVPSNGPQSAGINISATPVAPNSTTGAPSAGTTSGGASTNASTNATSAGTTTGTNSTTTAAHTNATSSSAPGLAGGSGSAQRAGSGQSSSVPSPANIAAVLAALGESKTPAQQQAQGDHKETDVSFGRVGSTAMPSPSQQGNGTQSSSAIPHTEADVRNLAHAIIGEAGGESQTGQAAVAHVIATRAAQNMNGNGTSVTNQINARNARGAYEFSFLGDSAKGVADAAQRNNTASYQQALTIARGVLNGTIANPAPDAKFYLNSSTATNPGFHNTLIGRNGSITIGNHTFTDDKANMSPAAVATRQASASTPAPYAGYQPTAKSQGERASGTGQNNFYSQVTDTALTGAAPVSPVYIAQAPQGPAPLMSQPQSAPPQQIASQRGQAVMAMANQLQPNYAPAPAGPPVMMAQTQTAPQNIGRSAGPAFAQANPLQSQAPSINAPGSSVAQGPSAPVGQVQTASLAPMQNVSMAMHGPSPMSIPAGIMSLPAGYVAQGPNPYGNLSEFHGAPANLMTQAQQAGPTNVAGMMQANSGVAGQAPAGLASHIGVPADLFAPNVTTAIRGTPGNSVNPGLIGMPSGFTAQAPAGLASNIGVPAGLFNAPSAVASNAAASPYGGIGEFHGQSAAPAQTASIAPEYTMPAQQPSVAPAPPAGQQAVSNAPGQGPIPAGAPTFSQMPANSYPAPGPNNTTLVISKASGAPVGYLTQGGGQSASASPNAVAGGAPNSAGTSPAAVTAGPAGQPLTIGPMGQPMQLPGAPTPSAPPLTIQKGPFGVTPDGMARGIMSTAANIGINAALGPMGLPLTLASYLLTGQSPGSYLTQNAQPGTPFGTQDAPGIDSGGGGGVPHPPTLASLSAPPSNSPPPSGPPSSTPPGGVYIPLPGAIPPVTPYGVRTYLGPGSNLTRYGFGPARQFYANNAAPVVLARGGRIGALSAYR